MYMIWCLSCNHRPFNSLTPGRAEKYGCLTLVNLGLNKIVEVNSYTLWDLNLPNTIHFLFLQHFWGPGMCWFLVSDIVLYEKVFNLLTAVFWDSLFYIYVILKITKTINHTEFSSNILLYSISNYPWRWDYIR